MRFLELDPDPLDLGEIGLEVLFQSIDFGGLVPHRGEHGSALVGRGPGRLPVLFQRQVPPIGAGAVASCARGQGTRLGSRVSQRLGSGRSSLAARSPSLATSRRHAPARSRSPGRGAWRGPSSSRGASTVRALDVSVGYESPGPAASSGGQQYVLKAGSGSGAPCACAGTGGRSDGTGLPDRGPGVGSGGCGHSSGRGWILARPRQGKLRIAAEIRTFRPAARSQGRTRLKNPPTADRAFHHAARPGGYTG